MNPDEAWQVLKDAGYLTHNKPADETVRFMQAQGETNIRVEDKIDNLDHKFEEKTDKILSIAEKTFEQAKLTNGRVNKLEERADALEVDNITKNAQLKVWLWIVGVVIGLFGIVLAAFLAYKWK